MNKLSISFLTLFLFISITAHTQPSAVKKAAQSVFTLTTFKADGSIHSSTKGVFAGKAGEGIAMWYPFNGASRAVVIDAKGKQHEVDAILGISELYNLCSFRIKDSDVQPVAITTSATAATSVYMVGYDLKNPHIKKLIPQRSEKFMTSNNYYVFDDNDISNTDLGCPIFNESGQLLGIVQRSDHGGQAYSADARLVNSFTISGMDINNQTFRATGLRVALPTDEQQASLMLMLAAQQDSVRYAAYIDDFIKQFPTATEGYNARAAQYVSQRKLALADAVLEQGVKQAAKKDEAYYNYSKAMYQASIYDVDTTYTDWNLSKALTLAESAEKVNPLPLYRHQQAQIIYSQGNYQRALDIFTALQSTEFGKNGEVYYEAALCKTMLKAPQSEIMALLDRAVTVQDGAVAAPYILARGKAYDAAGEYRKAFADYLKYDTLMNNRGTHDFYYLKFKCEEKLHQYQLALNDIAHAVVLNRYEPTYYAEMASLQLRVNKPEDAIKTCDIALQLTQEYADLYIIKGIALCETKQKQEGLEALQRARTLGDERAEALIAKYKK